MIPGDFIIPFQFQLPQDIPATIIYKQEKHPKKPKGFVKYYIRASLVTIQNYVEMDYKQVIIVR